MNYYVKRQHSIQRFSLFMYACPLISLRLWYIQMTTQLDGVLYRTTILSHALPTAPLAFIHTSLLGSPGFLRAYVSGSTGLIKQGILWDNIRLMKSFSLSATPSTLHINEDTEGIR